MAREYRIGWTEQGGWTGITEQDMADWKEAYPACDIKRQLAAAHCWCKANPAKRKKNWQRFIVNWLTRKQESGGDIPSNRPQELTRRKSFIREVLSGEQG